MKVYKFNIATNAPCLHNMGYVENCTYLTEKIQFGVGVSTDFWS